MSITIHPYLYARLVAVQEAFDSPGFRPVLAANTKVAPMAARKGGNNFKDLVKDEGDGKEGGSGGTMKGNRGKNAVNAANALRKLSRNR